MRIRPLHDFVVVKCEPFKEELYGGILHMPHQQRVRHGEVIAIGPGRAHPKTGRRDPLDVKLGQRVSFFRENMETQNGKQLVSVMHELSEEYGADLAIIPESAILGEVGRNTRVTAT